MASDFPDAKPVSVRYDEKLNSPDSWTNVCLQADYVNSHLYTDVTGVETSFGMFNQGYGYCQYRSASGPSTCGSTNKECTFGDYPPTSSGLPPGQKDKCPSN